MAFHNNPNRRTFLTTAGGITLAAMHATPAFAQGRGKKYAVIVGVEDYDPEELNPLRFSVQDATALSAELGRLGFDVTLMTGRSRRPQLKPGSPEKIRRVLTNRAAGLANDDTLIFAFMGHGVQFAADARDEVQELFFCPEDSRLADRNTLLSMKDVYETLASSRAGRKLLIVDACRDNPQPPRSKRNKSTELEPVGRAIRTVPKGMLALFSCSEGETSREYPQLDAGHGKGHGVFTYHLLKYLKGDAPAAWYPRQQMTVADMAHYVSRETKDFVWSKENKDQIPVPYGKVSPWSLGATPKQKLAKAYRSKSTGMEFVLVPKGDFLMGSSETELKRDDDEQQHRVTLSRSLYLGKYEVTQAEFQKIMGFNPSKFKDSNRLPVETVSWFDAVEFCNRLSQRDGYQPCYRLQEIEREEQSIQSADVQLIRSTGGYRLPTEAEWEYSCRAGTTTPFSFGKTISPQVVNYDGNFPYGDADKGEYRKRTVKVDGLSGNAWGLQQMHGNVWEWCHDWFGQYENRSVADPFGAKTGSARVGRGGGWINSASVCRSALRLRFSPGFRDNDLGFRVALVPAR